MAYAIGYMLPIIGVIGIIVFICIGLSEEAKLDNYIKEHNKDCDRRRAERNKHN